MNAPADPGEQILDRVLQFVTLLRQIGLALGTGQSLDAVRALTLIDLARRDDVYAALRAVLLDSHLHEEAFAAAFHRFWSQTGLQIEQHQAPPAGFAPRRQRRGPGGPGRGVPVDTEEVVRTLLAGVAPDEGGAETAGESSGAYAVAYSAAERLRQKDFADLTPRELAEMHRLLANLAFAPPLRRLRRTRPAAAGRLLDLRHAVRSNLRYGGELLVLPRRRRIYQPRPLTLICDISGSMDRYTRLLLRFLHAAAHGLGTVETFVFGTRLTRITHQLRLRNPDQALDEVAREVLDFSGGTRIGGALAAFNRRWARRVLGRGAIVVMISDGWDRGDPAVLAAEMSHLQRSCHLLVWLNPLLGLEGYQPLTRGMRAALPYIDLFLPSHNLASLESIAALLGRIGDERAARGRPAMADR